MIDGGVWIILSGSTTFSFRRLLPVDFARSYYCSIVPKIVLVSLLFLCVPMIDILRSQGILFASSYLRYHLVTCPIMTEISLHSCTSNLIYGLQLFNGSSFVLFKAYWYAPL